MGVDGRIILKCLLEKYGVKGNYVDGSPNTLQRKATLQTEIELC